MIFWAILAWGTANTMEPMCSSAQAQQSAPNNKSWTESITSPFKQGFEKLGHALDSNTTPRQNPPEDDALSLKEKSKPGPDLYVAIAHLYERAGNIPDAEKNYQLALKLNPDHLPALLGFAQLKEQTGKSNEALENYLRAAEKHPKEASVHNNLGLYYARHKRLDDAVVSLRRAIEIEPKNVRYRNNIATVLVDQGKSREALTHLSEVYGDAVAHYNLGYLLNKKGQTQAALQNFSLALQADPSMEAARHWVDYLQKVTTQARLPNHPAASGLKITSDKMASEKIASEKLAREKMASEKTTGAMPKSANAKSGSPLDNAPMPPDGTPPRRLPPTVQERPETQGPTLPGISYQRKSTPLAPLPPVTDTALRPLPRVN
jgi:tetratricopeptide (TPR) repeat protein